MENLPNTIVGLVVSSRGNFSAELAKERMEQVSCELPQNQFVTIRTILRTEDDVPTILNALKHNSCNALIIYLGNFGPEIPESLLAKRFDGPIMFAAAAEEDADHLQEKRGDAYCGLLNAGYNLSLYDKRVYWPDQPVDTPIETARAAKTFFKIARAQLGLRSLKVITFGPRPSEFVACNAPILPLYSLGIGIQENSELDLYASFLDHSDDVRIPDVVEEMRNETCASEDMDGIIPKLAQYELTLLDWIGENRGAYTHVCLANKCWPAFERCFGFVPCYVNSRFASRLTPIACEVDVYGALSEFILCTLAEQAATLLDINNTVPADLYEQDIAGKYPYRADDLFMGFHCGNTPKSLLSSAEFSYHKIMARQLEPDCEPDITRGTLEGNLMAGPVTLFRLQADGDGHLHAYIVEGEVLPVQVKSFGCIGIIAVREMKRFYRYGLLANHFPHHCAVVYSHVGRTLFDLLQLMGIRDTIYNQPPERLYPQENPFMNLTRNQNWNQPGK
jgi:L-fucose isomerase-like protein